MTTTTNRRDARGITKTPAIGVVGGGGKLITRMVDNVIAARVRGILLPNIPTRGTTLLTDESLLYQFADRYTKH